LNFATVARTSMTKGPMRGGVSSALAREPTVKVIASTRREAAGDPISAF
jgi:hypothetical protein